MFQQRCEGHRVVAAAPAQPGYSVIEWYGSHDSLDEHIHGDEHDEDLLPITPVLVWLFVEHDVEEEMPDGPHAWKQTTAEPWGTWQLPWIGTDHEDFSCWYTDREHRYFEQTDRVQALRTRLVATLARHKG